MTEKYQKRLEELQKSSNDPKLQKLFEEMVKLEQELDDLSGVEKYRRNPKNPAQIKIDPAFYAYHKTLGAYKEIVRVLLGKCDDNNEESPLRAYLRSINSRDEYTE